MILTGGEYSWTRVQQYNLAGSMGRLPDLRTGRSGHSCGSYIDSEGVVSTNTNTVDNAHNNISNSFPKYLHMYGLVYGQVSILVLRYFLHAAVYRGWRLDWQKLYVQH